jgi:hypothetical protein
MDDNKLKPSNRQATAMIIIFGMELLFYIWALIQASTPPTPYQFVSDGVANWLLFSIFLLFGFINLILFVMLIYKAKKENIKISRLAISFIVVGIIMAVVYFPISGSLISSATTLPPQNSSQ